MTNTFHVWDKVQIKEWDEMLNEFGIDLTNSRIKTRLLFTSDMRRFCGATAVITDTDDVEWVELKFDDNSLQRHANMCLFDVDMIERL